MQITALARALKLNISVAYLDGHSPEGKVEFVPFQNVDADAIGAQPLFLLYRYNSCPLECFTRCFMLI